MLYPSGASITLTIYHCKNSVFLSQRQVNFMKKKLYSTKEIRNAFGDYFYGSGADFFFPHPKLDETPEKECKEIVKMRCKEFLEILEHR